MKKTVLKKYARLIAKTGANVQKGQSVIVYASVEVCEFAAMVVEECYRLGASDVRMEWSYQPIEKLDNRFQSVKKLSSFPKWKEEKLKAMSEELPVCIHILSEDPDGLNGMNLEKMQKARMTLYPLRKPYIDAMEDKYQWTIAAAPTAAWAKKVFPELKKSQAVEKLWETILKTVYVSENADNDPIVEWIKHDEELRERCKWLNERNFDYLTYKSSNGTDFRCDLIPDGMWCGGGGTNKLGVFTNANLPTEEVFTSPIAGKCEGTLVSTKPLSWNGQLIEDFSIRFEGGKAVEWKAAKGQEVLDRMLGLDEGAKMLGELALIPNDSPINNSGILFYETLFDENASCHVALGRGFNDTIKNYENLSNEECRAKGINDSMIHVDFMVGAPDLCVTGWKDGKSTPVFVNGEWAQQTK